MVSARGGTDLAESLFYKNGTRGESLFQKNGTRAIANRKFTRDDRKKKNLNIFAKKNNFIHSAKQITLNGALNIVRYQCLKKIDYFEWERIGSDEVEKIFSMGQGF